MKKMNSPKHLAYCLCKNVQFQIKGTLRHVINCHCFQCMKTHGNYASYTACEEKNIKFIKKTTLKWFRSSKIAKRGFCSKCGASIFYKRLDEKKISISAGILKNPTNINTYANIFIKGKMDYYKLNLNSKILNFFKYTK